MHEQLYIGGRMLEPVNRLVWLEQNIWNTWGFLEYQAEEFRPYPKSTGELQMVLKQTNLMNIVIYKDKSSLSHVEIIFS